VTLRLRLLLLLVGIVAAGLIISDVVTYNALRAFLTTRVDQQLQVAAFPVGRALLSSSGLGPQVPAAPPDVPVGPGTSSTGPTPTATTKAGGSPTPTNPFASPGTFRNGGGLFGRGRAADRGVLVPPGTYGQLRSPQGTVRAHLFFAYGGQAPSAPTIPAKLPGRGLPASRDYYFTTSGTGPGAVNYRALAKPLANGRGVIVVAVPLGDLESTLRHLLWIELVVSGLVLVGLGVLSWVMVRRDLRPLESMTRTAGAIAQGDMTQRVSPVSGGTEVGQLGEAFNSMIDEIEMAFAQRTESEDRLRRFLADASHELRTPLASILGYSELFDLGMQDRPADLAVSLRHIRDEAGRMATLVDDLFLLAQLDHERPMRIERVDLVELAHRAADGLSVSAPDRPVVVEGDGPVEVDGDPDRLRQVVDNLAGNAVGHTPPGTAVEIRVAADAARSATGGPAGAVITVHDDGPGIDPVEAPRVFEAFYRSDPSRSRSSGGAGLGLAIVAAIVEAHGGSVALLPGPGATFEVRLPVTQAPPVPNDVTEVASATTAPATLPAPPSRPGDG
jgi:two-component system, OmpR family, sensor kinase